MELTSQMGDMQSKSSKAEGENLSIKEKLLVSRQSENKLKQELEELKKLTEGLKKTITEGKSKIK